MTVFAVLTHGDPTTFTFLVDALSPHPVVAHVDSSTDDRAYPKRPNLHYVRDRVNVHWGGFSVVEATLKLYEAALDHAQNPREHIVLLSGQCVPTRPIQELESYLISRPWGQHCNAGLLLDGFPRNEDRVTRFWYFDLFDARGRLLLRKVSGALRRIAQLARGRRKREDFDEFEIVAGSQWTAFTAECLRDLLSDEGKLDRLSQLLRFALAPDEIYFHSLLFSSDWRTDVENPQLNPKSDLRTRDFANLHHIDISLTRVMKADDLPLIDMSRRFFVRKVDLRVNPEMRDLIWTRISGGQSPPKPTSER